MATIIFACAFLCGTARALDPTIRLTQHAHRIWQVQQGLPDATIYKIIQTSDGYIWLGTSRGVTKFDGVRFTPLRLAGDANLDRVAITDMADDGRGGVWVATDGSGVIHIAADKKIITLGRKEGLPTERIDGILQMPDGTLLVSCGAMVAAVNQNKISSVVYTAEAGESEIIMSRQGDKALLAGDHSHKISVYGASGIENRITLQKISDDAVIQALCVNQDGLWVGTTDGLIRVADTTETLLTVADGLADNQIISLTQGNNGVLWVGTKNGFSRYYAGEFASYRAVDGLSQSTVHTLCEDREGGLWVGTKHGLDQLIDARTLPFTTSEGLPSNNIGPILQDHAGRIWAGTLNAGLSIFDGHLFTPVNALSQAKTIYSLCDDTAGTLWAGTNIGAARIKGEQAKFYTQQEGLPANDVTVMARDNRGIIWAGTEHGLAFFNGKNFVTSGPVANIQAIYPHGKGGVYVAAENIVYLVKDQEWQKIAAARRITALYEDRDEMLWIGTAGDGLMLVQGEKSWRLTTAEGLSDDDIFGIITDARDHLWIGCSKGLFTVNRKDLVQLATGAAKSVRIMPISPTDSLRTAECRPGMSPAIALMNDGRIWVSTFRGIVVINPQNIPRKLNAPPVVIDSVIVNGTEMRPEDIVNMWPGNKNIEFRFTALSYIAPTRIRFKYRLDGFDRDWVDAGTRREVTYTNLPPGKYQFRVAACNADGTWNIEGANASLMLMPRFTQRAWFIWLCIGATLGIAWLLYLWRIHAVRRDLNLIAAERGRIARELHDTLIQGFSGVTMEMQALSVRIDNPAEKTQLNDIIRDAGNCLREARHSVAGLRQVDSSENGLSQELSRIARELTSGHTVRLTLQLNAIRRRLPGHVEHNMIRIASEAIGNSIRHAQAKNITVELHEDDMLLRMCVRDDGKGYDQDADTPAGHFGIIGMRERATEINASIMIDSEPGKGTSVTISLPLKQRSGTEEQSGDPQTT